MSKLVAYISFLFFFRGIFAQEQSLFSGQVLDTVKINGNTILDTKTDSLYILNGDSTTTPHLAGEWLATQTPFQTRIYGAGMTAGLSLRGAPVSHVQVIWNGIPLNSPLNGQTDLNMISPAMSEKIALYRGGLSQLFGSGAMAGALILSNPLEFAQQSSVLAQIRMGSFGLKYGLVRWKKSSRKWTFILSADHEDNENLFRIPSIGYINRNARTLNRHIQFTSGYQNTNSLWQTHFMHNYSNRFLPGTRTTTSRSQLIMQQTAWQIQRTQKKFLLGTFDILAAAVNEKYRYYHIAGQAISGSGQANTYKLRLATTGSPKKTNAQLYYDILYVEGQTKNYSKHKRLIQTLGGRVAYQLHQWNFILGLRIQQCPGTFIPPTGFFSIAWHPAQNYLTSWTFSTNFRMPTFNDLYWQPGGNPSLKPERNHEWEWIHIWQNKKLYLRLSAYYRFNRDLIRWMPGQNGLWHPVNINHTRTRGFEFSGHWKYNSGLWKTKLMFSYNFQDGIDLQTKRPLSFIPLYLWSTAFRIEYGRLYMIPQIKFQSYYYTDASNTHFAPSVLLAQLHAGWQYKNIHLDLQITNLFNTYYEWIPGYPMPGRGIRVGLTYKLNHKNK